MESQDAKLERALDLMRRLPPQSMGSNLKKVIDLCPELLEELLSAVDQPLSVMRDDMKKRDFIICDYNRDGDSFRSPWSNIYYPYISDGYMPPIQLQTIENELNEAMRVYANMYYGEDALSSCYVWDIDAGFAAAILIKKTTDGDQKGCWDSINVMEVSERLGRPSHYKLTTTVMTWLQNNGEDNKIDLGGSLTRQKEEDIASPNGHITNIGQMVELMENNIRQQIESVYFGKTRDILSSVRSLTSLSRRKQLSGLSAQINSAIMKRSTNE